MSEVVQPAICVIIPTLNEAESIGRTLSQLDAETEKFDIIVIDDNSSDGTHEIVSAIAKTSRHRIHCYVRTAPRNGLGGALLEGYQFAYSMGFQIIAQMDADGQHKTEDLISCLEVANSGHTVFGSRYVPQGSVRGWSKPRIALSKLGNNYFRVIHNSNRKDNTGGLRVFQRQTLERIWRIAPTSKGFTFHAEASFRHLLLQIPVIEIPISFEARKAGSSKLKFSSAFESLVLITYWRLSENHRSTILIADANV